jgi:hypothetical protein
MSQDQIHVVMCNSYSPGSDQGHISIHRVFTTPEAAEACRARLAAKWGTSGYAPQFEVEVHDVVDRDVPSSDGWS